MIPNPVYLESFSAFKANPIPMAFGELYSALETRTVDGQENPYTVILSNKFYEVQKYVSATNHTFTQNIILVSKIFWDKLSPTEQRMMQEAYDESRDYQKEQTRLQTEKALSELQAKGMQLQRGGAGRAGAHAQGRPARGRQDLRQPQAGDGEALQRRARPHPQRSEVNARLTRGRTEPFRFRPELSVQATSWNECSICTARFLKGVIALCLAVMVVLVFGNVVLRYGFNSGITISEELSRWLLVWLTFLGAIVAVREHTHLGVDTLVRMLSPTGKRICFIVNYCLMLFADWLLLSGSWRQTLINMDDRAPATGLSLGIFYFVGVVFGVSAGVMLLYDLYRVVSGQASEADLVAVRESEEH